MIEIKNLSKTFISGEQTIHAVDNISLSIPDGEFLIITGRSGSGKSTFLYQLGLLDHPSQGQILMDGIEVTALSSAERTDLRLHALGYIFQDYAILPSLTALENVVIPLLMLGLTKDVAYLKAKNALDKVGLGDRLNNLPSALSGGQQQRVAIARAIAHDPKIIFADEPTANLDSETATHVMEVFVKLNKEGQTIVMVSHEPEFTHLGHRVITLSDGKIVSDTRALNRSIISI